jgi:hypothetical protein
LRPGTKGESTWASGTGSSDSSWRDRAMSLRKTHLALLASGGGSWPTHASMDTALLAIMALYRDA